MQNFSIYKKSHTEHNSRKKRVLCSRMCERYIACVILSVILFIGMFSAILNVNTAFAQDARQSSRTIKAGIFSFDGYHMTDAEGRYTGYGIRVLNLISEYSTLRFRFLGFDKSYDENLEMLERGEVDVVTSVSRSAKREQIFDYSLPIGRKRIVLSVKVDNTKYTHGNYANYNGMKIGMLDDNSQVQLEDFSSPNKKNFTYDKVYYKDDIELANALHSGEVDAILSSDLRKAKNEKVLDIVADVDFYAVVRKGESELLDEINYGIEQMNLNEGDWKNVLFYQFYGPVYDSALSFTEREKAYINQVNAEKRTITATALGNRAPYSYIENGQLKGIIPDYFAEIMKLANLPYTLVVPKNNEEYENIVSSNGVDVLLDRERYGDIVADTVMHGFNSESYMSASLAMVTRKDLKNEIKVVAVCDSQGKNDLEMANALNEFDVVKPYATGDEALKAVLNKEVDAAYVYSYTAQLFIGKDRTNSLYYRVVNDLDAKICMFIGENVDHELITILNKCIKQQAADTLKQLALKYVSYTLEDLNLWQYLGAHPETILIICFAITLAAGIIAALYFRGRWNRKLFYATEATNKKISEQLAIVEALSRDYINVFAINETKGTATIIKLEGYVIEGLKKDSVEEYDYSSFVEKYINSRVHQDDRKKLSVSLSLDNVSQKLAISDEYVGSYRIIINNGEIHHFQFAFFKITKGKGGHDDFILVGFRNIDEIIRKEQEQQKTLSEALVQAQYANKSKTAFLNNMSHDIRTPMNAIIGFTSLAATHIDNKEQIQGYLSKIMTSSNHLLSLINDVLDMSRIESGKVNIEEKEVSLPEILHDLRTIVQSDVKAKQLEFYIDTLDVTNETIICDRLRLNQVLLNILSNAMKYTNPGGIVSVRVIQTSTATDGRANYEFHVKDTGIGMSKEFLKHVFEPFEREHTSTVSGIQGTGLGLTITKNIVDMMGGSISVESESGKGSEFTVKFCFSVADNSGESPRLEQLENLRALVVDDDVNTCISVSKMLSTIGMRPEWTTHGNEAIIHAEFAKEQNEPYHAYIIDWLMPDMNGIELVRRIRKKIGNTAPVIILTAYDWSDIENEAREAGVTAFCSKPLFLSELRNVLSIPYKKAQKVKEKREDEEMRFDGMKLLLVEDNELNQEIAQTILESAGFVIDTANDGSVAVEQIKNAKAGTYDLILMDIQMPIMNGYEATKAIRALPIKAKANIPIVAMTANAFEEDRREAMNAGMNGHLAKPIDVKKLMQLLNDILK